MKKLTKEEQKALTGELISSGVIFNLDNDPEAGAVMLTVPLYNVIKEFNLLALDIEKFNTFMQDVYAECRDMEWPLLGKEASGQPPTTKFKTIVGA